MRRNSWENGSLMGGLGGLKNPPVASLTPPAGGPALAWVLEDRSTAPPERRPHFSMSRRFIAGIPWNKQHGDHGQKLPVWTGGAFSSERRGRLGNQAG